MHIVSPNFCPVPFSPSPTGLTLWSGDIAVEAFTCLLIFKNVFSFGLTFGAYDWLTKGGFAKIFYIMGSVQVAICLLSIPMCKYLRYSLPLSCSVLMNSALSEDRGDFVLMEDS